MYKFKRLDTEDYAVKWIPSFRCNWACPYCIEAERRESSKIKSIEDVREEGRYINDELIEKKLKRPTILLINGGEPSLYDYTQILSSEYISRICINSNFSASNSWYETLEENYPGKLHFLFSYHPSQEDAKWFLEKLENLKFDRARLKIHYVYVGPQAFEKDREVLDAVRSLGIRVKVTHCKSASSKDFVRTPSVLSFYGDPGRTVIYEDTEINENALTEKGLNIISPKGLICSSPKKVFFIVDGDKSGVCNCRHLNYKTFIDNLDVNSLKERVCKKERCNICKIWELRDDARTDA